MKYSTCAYLRKTPTTTQPHQYYTYICNSLGPHDLPPIEYRSHDSISLNVNYTLHLQQRPQRVHQLSPMSWPFQLCQQACRTPCHSLPWNTSVTDSGYDTATYKCIHKTYIKWTDIYSN